ncbi:MAG: phosphomannomutase, partial [Mycobacterium sp.]|nr:phosphomannomutase [Mycobacterium sp.]
EAVRDKDGISAAVLCCDLLATAKTAGEDIPGILDDLARRHGVHLPVSFSAPTDDATEVTMRIRRTPPTTLAGFAVTAAEHPDVLVLSGGDDRARVRMAIRPSGTEPKIKVYTEIRLAATGDLAAARRRAEELCDAVRRDGVALLQRHR